jgi:hypothetical protein
MELWVTAWIISLCCAAGAVVCGLRAGLRWTEMIVFTSMFFPAPLFVAIGGGNSFVYAFDLTVPVALWLVAARWSSVPRAAKAVAAWLLVGVSVVPLVLVLCLAEREHILYAGISLYRLVGAMAVMCAMAVAGTRNRYGSAGIMGAIGWMNVVLVVATLLQSQGWINSNVFYSMGNEGSVEENDSMRYITAGLFRGSLGIIGTLGWVAFLAQAEAGGWRRVGAIAGGAAGGLLIVLCGSKTSLLAAMVTTLAACLLYPRMLRLLWRRLALVLVGLGVVAGVYLYEMDTNYFNYTLGVLGLADQSLDTFNYRQERWQEAMDLLRQDPQILLGLATPFGSDRGMAYFHNEYIALLMGGGIWSEGAYLLGLVLLGAKLLRRRGEAQPARLFGGLTFIASLIGGASVNHVAPGIFFGCTVLLTACAYGVGLGRPKTPSATDETLAEESEPEPAELQPAAQEEFDRPRPRVVPLAQPESQAP